jgi:hypothetical protein
MTAQDKRKKNNKKQIKINQLRVLRIEQEFLKIHICINLQTAFAVETHLAVRQWLEDQVNMLKLRTFRVETRRPTILRTEGQYLVPLKTLIQNKGSM